MDKLQRVAHEIIDLVENEIRKAHPSIDKKALAQKGKTLLYGETYYDLENEIVEILSKI